MCSSGLAMAPIDIEDVFLTFARSAALVAHAILLHGVWAPRIPWNRLPGPSGAASRTLVVASTSVQTVRELERAACTFLIQDTITRRCRGIREGAVASRCFTLSCRRSMQPGAAHQAALQPSACYLWHLLLRSHGGNFPSSLLTIIIAARKSPTLIEIKNRPTNGGIMLLVETFPKLVLTATAGIRLSFSTSDPFRRGNL